MFLRFTACSIFRFGVLFGLLTGCSPSPASTDTDTAATEGSSTPSPVANPSLRRESAPSKTAETPRAAVKNATLQFISEKIQINVLPGGKEVAIAGRYLFANPRRQKWFSRIYFPFFIDDVHPRPTTITVAPGAYKKHKQGIAVPVKIKAQNQKEITIAYRQSAPDQTATHLVSSAMAFGKNLETARFDLILPSPYRLYSSSYPLKLYKEDGDCRIYRYEQTPFTPDTDFTVSWR
ncbi:MAG: hypothetical protein JXR45_12875 [Deltaproteobacteria bacterium]|nr:hypothetical protein [Deltaproteobacteria bacterium]